MAKPWRHATIICTVLTVIAAIGALLALITGNVLWAIVFLLPAAGYQAYRTEGESTRWASWVLLVLLVATVTVTAFRIDYDLVQLIGEEETRVAGHTVPLGDVKTVMPALVAVCALILLTRTRGRYTRWLAGVIFVSAVVIVFATSPESVGELIEAGLGEAMR